MGHLGSVYTNAVKSSREIEVPPHDVKNWQNIKRRKFRKLIIFGKTTEFQIDNGTDVSNMGSNLMEFFQVRQILVKTTAKLGGVSGKELKVKGDMKLFVEYLGEKHLTIFIVMFDGLEFHSG